MVIPTDPPEVSWGDDAWGDDPRSEAVMNDAERFRNLAADLRNALLGLGYPNMSNCYCDRYYYDASGVHQNKCETARKALKSYAAAVKEGVPWPTTT